MREFIMKETEEQITFGNVWKQYTPTAELIRCRKCGQNNQCAIQFKFADPADPGNWFCAYGSKGKEAGEMLKFTWASVVMNDNGEPEYTPKSQICVRASSIDWFYDHKVCIGDHKIPVMESFDEIRKKVRESGELCD